MSSNCNDGDYPKKDSFYKMRKYLKSNYKILTIAFFVFILDQISKSLAIRNLIKEETIVFIPKILGFRLVKNTGAAFSFLEGNTGFLAIISLSVSIIILFWLGSNKKLNFNKTLGIGLLLGGTIGNGLDRFRYASVTDFLQFLFINFPIFNVADIAINLALLFFLLDYIFENNIKSIK